MTATKLDIPRGPLADEPGFEVRGQVFRFSPDVRPDPYARMNNSATDDELLQHADAFIESALSPEDVDRWRDLRGPQTRPALWYDEIIAVARHIAGVAGNRPTMPSNGSSPTGSKSGTASTEDSPSPVAVPSAA